MYIHVHKVNNTVTVIIPICLPLLWRLPACHEGQQSLVSELLAPVRMLLSRQINCLSFLGPEIVEPPVNCWWSTT